jgi:hypothetical protein
VADWSQGDPQVFRASAETVHQVAAAVLADLDQTDPHEPETWSRLRVRFGSTRPASSINRPAIQQQRGGNNEERP